MDIFNVKVAGSVSSCLPLNGKGKLDRELESIDEIEKKILKNINNDELKSRVHFYFLKQIVLLKNGDWGKYLSNKEISRSVQ